MNKIILMVRGYNSSNIGSFFLIIIKNQGIIFVYFSLNKLLCTTMSQGMPLYLPVIGSGFSKIYSSEIDILKYIIATFALYRSRIHNDIYIVIRDNAKSEISISNICCYYL